MRMKRSRNASRDRCLWAGVAICAGLLAFFLPQGVGSAAEKAEPYREHWELAMQEVGMQHLILEMSAINVVVEPYDGKLLEVDLDATRKPSSNGELPVVTLEATEVTVSIAETYPKQGKLPFLGNWTSGELEGTLTLRIPMEQVLAELSIQSFSGEVFMDKVNAATLYVTSSSGGIHAVDCVIDYGAALETFSGALEATGLRAESMHLASSSGGIRMERAVAPELCIAESFSGDLEIYEMEAGALELGSSSGNIALKAVRSASLTMNTFSGSISIKELTVEDGVEITASSGTILLRDLSAQSLETEQFSGGIDFEDVSLAETARMTSSSGNLEGAGLTAGSVEMETFSGGISLSNASVDALQAQTSSGPCTVWLTREAETSLTTFSGDVTLSLPRDSSFDYAIDTFSGGIEFGFQSVREDTASLSARAGQVGEGGPAVRIDTSSGAVVVLAIDE